jgi:Xaa-Pro aminopeptidase
MNIIEERINMARSLMRTNGLDGYIIPSSDWHQSEYPADYFKVREYFSGFTGSNALLVILLDRSALWTDGRYYLQAEKELENTEIVVMKQGLSNVLDPIPWLMQQLRPNQVVGVDSRVVSMQWYQQTKQALDIHQVKLSDVSTLFDSIITNRSDFPRSTIYPLNKEYYGTDAETKLINLRTEMRKKHIENYLIASLDDIAWLCNLRGSDITYTPVFYAYLLVGLESATLFVQDDTLTPEAKSALKNVNIQIDAYANVEHSLARMTLGNVYLCADKVNALIGHVLERNNKIIPGIELTSHVKAIKNSDEIASTKSAHHQDGVAMVRFMYYVENAWKNQLPLTEWDLAEKLYEERNKASLFTGFSFTPIVGTGSNGAVVHYHPTQKTSAIIQRGLTVVDSGGQYMGATTDLTRMLCLGELTEEERTDYTLVLKTHIALANSIFLAGATGAQLDGIARQVLWRHGIDYKHGTGHGVGAMLSVHEGPQSLKSYNFESFHAGMITSIEPGLYRDNKHGIRIENLYVTYEKQKNHDGSFLAFESLTLCPIDTTPLRRELLTQEEINWINKYHQLVLRNIGPLLNAEELEYLQEKTHPLS